MNGIKVEGDRYAIDNALEGLSDLLPHKPTIASVSTLRDKEGDYIGTRRAGALMDLLYALQNAARPATGPVPSSPAAPAGLPAARSL